MDKICINGEEWIRLNDICDIFRVIGNDPVFENTDSVLNQVAHLMFYDEIQAAGDDEEKRNAAIEFPGDFVVYKKLGYVNPNGKKLIYFMEFADGEAKAIDSIDKAMVFNYESMADSIAKKLGDGWKSVCVGIESGRIVHRMKEAFDKILADAEEEEQNG